MYIFKRLKMQVICSCFDLF